MDILKEYLEYKKAENCSPKTLEVQKNNLTNYIKWLNENKIDVLKVKREHIIKYRSFMVNKKSNKGPKTLDPATIRSRLSMIRSLYNYFIEINKIKSNPANGISIQTKERLPIYLNEDELYQYAEIAKANRINHLIFLLIVSTGVRISELVNVKKNDIHMAECRITVIGKGDKQRNVYFMPSMRTEISENIRELKGNDTIFGDVRSEQAVRRRVRLMTSIFNQDRKEAGKDKKNITPHKLRHTYATKCYRDGVDVETIRKTMGHVKINTTMIYTHVEDYEAQQRLNGRKNMGLL